MLLNKLRLHKTFKLYKNFFPQKQKKTHSIKNKKVQTIKSKKAQAMIEFVLMVPFLMTIMIFVYQGYVMIHKVQVAQKYLKASIVATLRNKPDMDIDPINTGTGGTTLNPNPVHAVFFTFDDAIGKKMLLGVDDVTKSLLISFGSAKQQKQMDKILKGLALKQELGVCLGSNIQTEVAAEDVFKPAPCGP